MRALAAVRRFSEAFDAGMTSIAADPLRESAHRAVVRLHLAEGNVGAAVRQYELCRRLLDQQLGIEPTQLMDELVHRRRRVVTAVVARPSENGVSAA